MCPRIVTEPPGLRHLHGSEGCIHDGLHRRHGCVDFCRVGEVGRWEGKREGMAIFRLLQLRAIETTDWERRLAEVEKQLTNDKRPG